MGFPRLMIILCFAILTNAFTTFSTNCTLPSGPDTVSYVSEPNTRGTLTIVWSCLFTIISCTWTVQHPDVPSDRQREHYLDGKLGWLKWKLKRWKNESVWFLGTIIAPEILLAKHLGDLRDAQALMKDFKEVAMEDDVQWTLTHCMFAVMGGFVMRSNVPLGKRPDQIDRSVQTEDKGTEATMEDHSAGDEVGSEPTKSPTRTPECRNEDASLPSEVGPQAQTNDKEAKPVLGFDKERASNDPAYTNPQPLNPKQILALREKKVLPRLPDISVAEINDKSKSDSLVRLIAVFQILWLCTQVIVRKTRDLAVSQLEISTVAFAFCAVIMYALSWVKPKGVEVPVTILAFIDGGEEAYRIIKPEYFVDEDLQDETVEKKSKRKKDFWDNLADKFALYFKTETEINPFWVPSSMVVSGMLFGGVHVIAWDFAFPTHTEMVLWRVAALYCTCFPPAIFALVILLMIVFYILGDDPDDKETTQGQPQTKSPSLSQSSDDQKPSSLSPGLLSDNMDNMALSKGPIAAGPLPSMSGIKESDKNPATLPSDESTLSNTQPMTMKEWMEFLGVLLLIAIILPFTLTLSLSFVFYVLARLYLLVEMFRALAFQPMDAYVGTWTVNIPNVS